MLHSTPSHIVTSWTQLCVVAVMTENMGHYLVRTEMVSDDTQACAAWVDLTCDSPSVSCAYVLGHFSCLAGAST